MLSARKYSSKYVERALFTLSQRYNTKIIIPLRCHIPLDKIPKQVQKKLNKAEKYLNFLGVSIKKIQLPSLDTFDTSDTSKHDNGSQKQKQMEESLLDESNALIVGSIHQYPQITHYNQAKILQIFGKNRLNKTSWTFDSKIQENYNIPLSTAIDYYPFINTFPAQNIEENKSKKNPKHFNQLNNKWKVRRRGYNIGYRDSFDDKLPLLSREYNTSGDEQQLVVYRDVPYDINSLLCVLPIIREYEPDIIVFEYGRLPFFDKYIERKLSFSNVIMPIKKLVALLTPIKILSIGMGRLFYAISKKLYKTEISSYGFESTLDFVSKSSFKKRNKNKRKIAMIAGDLHHKITDTLRVFNDYLDLYNIATLLHYDIINDKFIRASTRVQLGDNLANIIQMRLYPHMTCMNVYRNDMLSCVINELNGEKYEKILLISQGMRLKDLYDKLCGKMAINKWIKTMDSDHILMNKLNLYQYHISMTNTQNTYIQNVVDSELDEDIQKCIGYLGYQQTAFLLLKYPLMDEIAIGKKLKKEQLIDIQSNDLNEHEFVNQFKTNIDQISQQLKAKYG